MTNVFIGLGVVVVLLAIAMFLSYNRFIRQRQTIDNSWSNVDTELRRRYDMIPNLVRVVQGYAEHEQSTLRELTEARTTAVATNGPVDQQSRAEGLVVSGLRHVFAVAEDYPNLKADQHFLELQHELVNTEDRIQSARRFFNQNVKLYNARVESFPSMILAGWFDFEKRAYFEVDRAVDHVPTV